MVQPIRLGPWQAAWPLAAPVPQAPGFTLVGPWVHNPSTVLTATWRAFLVTRYL